MSKNKFWVGIGASAGGLEALKELVQTLREKNAVYIIAQHLDPKHPTILRDLLERSTQLPINLIDDDTDPLEGQIYIIPPGHNAIIKDEKIVLTPAAPVGPKPSINEFFTSLAQQMGEQAVGVILSGTGSDGAQGIIAIKAAGGLTFSQDEISAKYSGMPRSAIETGVIDFVLTPREIAEELKVFFESAYSNSKFSGPKVRSSLEKIFQRLYDQTNYDFSGYKIKTIQRRIQRRMVVNKVITIDDYLTLLVSSTAEVENLFKELLISVTAFFRDPDAFTDLNAIIENMIQNCSPSETLRIWVPGCARGEEAYSIAILFEEAKIKLRSDIRYQIFATDIDDYALNKARQGIYTEEQVKEINTALLKRYFNQYEDVFILKKDIRDQIVFAKQNVIMDPPFSHLDLISCRNVMIYFNLETQKKVFQIFHFALKSKGYLFLGKSESAVGSSPELFHVEKKISQIFSRRMIEPNHRADQIHSAKLISNNQISPPSEPKIQVKESFNLKEQLEQTLIKNSIPAAVVVNSQGLMLHVRGDLNRFLTIPEGRIDNNILTMARDNLKIDIRSLLQRAKREDNTSAQALFFNDNTNQSILYLTLSKIVGSENDDLYVLAFFDLNIDEGTLPGLVESDLKEMSHERLQHEVNIFRERLQSSIQDLETTNEELQSTNEELQSANEELQSANEELQTANEELQSTNEELSTVNEELEIKTHELSQVNNDLESMLWNIDELILFVDNRLRLKRYTEKAAKEFHLSREDLTQVVTSFELSQDIPNLRIELLNVIEKESERTIKLRKDNMFFDLRLVAYKADEKEVVGIMMFFEKILLGKRQNHNELNKFLTLFEHNTRHPFLCIGQDDSIIFATESASKLLSYYSTELLNLKMGDLIAQDYNSFEEVLNENAYTDQDGWTSLALEKKSKERFVVKYRLAEINEYEISERIIFLDINKLN